MRWNELCKKLKEDAIRVGMPDVYLKQISEKSTQQDIISILKESADFCIAHRWPTTVFIKHHFTRDILFKNGILIDDDANFPTQNGNRRLEYLNKFILLGDSNANIKYSFRPHSGTIWVCDNSTITIDAKYGAIFEVHLYGNASAHITTDLVSKATVIRHSRHTVVNKNGVVTTVNDFRYLE